MSYNQHIASSANYGVVKVGSGLSVIDGVISSSSSPTADNYGFITSVTSQANPVANAINIVTYDVLGPSNGISIGPGNNNIIVANAGTYAQTFSVITSKTSGGTAVISLWLRRNGIDLVGSQQELPLTNTLSAVFISGNYTLNLAAGDNIQMCWSSADTTTGLAALPAGVNPVRPSGYAVKITLIRVS